MTTGVNIRRSVANFMLSSLVLLAAWAAGVAFLIGRSEAIDLFLFTAPLVVVFCVFAMAMPSLFRRDSGQPAPGFEAANVLTAVRLFLVPPMLVFLVHGHLMWGAMIYGTILLTDVFDGYVARRFGQETLFGLMLDPFADIASTMAAFSWLYAGGVVPRWLLFVLITRYSEFFLGIVILAAIGRIPKLHATMAGKVAGLVQG
ncbi:MAG TPA: CDP-alcohol phosphatidyltransferase family protein, partial [Candidatus Krumholzibacterium sp.]|nr:CDP-alcohol phosphatidyltransferase family protein [Candidatus Krumholzibacterium sp.]